MLLLSNAGKKRFPALYKTAAVRMSDLCQKRTLLIPLYALKQFAMLLIYSSDKNSTNGKMSLRFLMYISIHRYLLIKDAQIC